MAEDLESLAVPESKSTRKTNVLTQEQALEILQQALLEYQKAGGQIEFVPEFYWQGKSGCAIILANVRASNGNLEKMSHE